MDAVTQAPIGGATVISGTAATDRAITLNALIDAYIMNYTGRDKARHHRFGRWRSRLGERAVTSISDEDVFQALEAYAAGPARVYAGRDADGNRIFRAKGHPSDSTVNDCGGLDRIAAPFGSIYQAVRASSRITPAKGGSMNSE